MAAWDYVRFKEKLGLLRSLPEIDRFIVSFDGTAPIKHASFAYWRRWASGVKPSLELAGVPHSAPPSTISNLRQAAIASLCFERVLPINFLDEVEANTELGQHLLGSFSLTTVAATGLAIPVRGPGGESGLLLACCDVSPSGWRGVFEANAGTAQLMAQELFLTVRAALGPDRQVLSPREKECLALVANGHTAKAIARELNLSDQTVTFYLSRIRMKLDVANTTEAVARALELGLITLR